jgi:plasmid stability protein
LSANLTRYATRHENHTPTLDDDVFYAVKLRAKHQRRSAGAVTSELPRQALTGPAAPTPAPEPAAADESLLARGFRPLPRRGGAVTNELVNRLRQDIGE